MAESLTIYVAGDPVGQPRARCIPLPGGKVKLVSTADKKKKAYKTRLIAAMKRAAKKQGWQVPELVACYIVAFYSTRSPERWGNYCGKKPDRDNIDKLILDCAGKKNGAGIITDDAKVAQGGVMKIWSRHGGVSIIFYSLDGMKPPDPERDDLGAIVVTCEPEPKTISWTKQQDPANWDVT
jgi:Holliday junction resolvase RusA-like endonuclease